jgi:prepilin-type N-terminal cleavage/methylation domain-containing protein
MLKSKIKFARQARKKVSAFSLQPSALASAFTLLELLVVISILGILAALTVPVLKNFGKSDATLSGSRQLLDGVARARQLAVSQRTTVYMVFVPTNFWIDTARQFPNPWFNNLSSDLRTAVTNLADKQLSGFNFIARGAMGDQPGQHAWHYLDRWQALPEGTFIAYRKFTLPPPLPIGTPLPPNYYYRITNQFSGAFYDICGFHTNGPNHDTFPFPAEKGTNAQAARINLPYLAFNYLGQLTVDGQTVADRDEYLPLAAGTVMAARNPVTKAFVLDPSPPVPNTPDVQENPPGNSTNISYSIVHIDRLTGRAVLKFHKMTP